MGAVLNKTRKNQKRPDQKKDSCARSQHRNTSTEIELCPEPLSDFNSGESEVNALSSSMQDALLSRSSCGQLNKITTIQWGTLRRANNSSPSVSTHVTSLTERNYKRLEFEPSLNFDGHVTPVVSRNISPRSISHDESRDSLRRTNSASLVEDTGDVVKPSKRKSSTLARSGFGGDTGDTIILPIKQVQKQPLHLSRSRSLSSNCPNPKLPMVPRKIPRKMESRQNPSTGDLDESSYPRAPIPNQIPRNSLSRKPPTPPNKLQPSRNMKSARRTLMPLSRRYTDPTSYDITQPFATTLHVSNTPVVMRPKSASPSDKRIRLPRNSSFANSPRNFRAETTDTQNSKSDLITEHSACLSRIEYTFYINDNEEYQRPFHDRRIETVAKATQCSIFLHKPLHGHKPVYYKGNKVLPVTISSRTMIALKRCISRLDMQYPYFNVKAFCPPDMY